MNLRPDSLFLGVAPSIAIECAKSLRFCLAGFDSDDFCRALGAPVNEAIPVLEALIEQGYVDRKRGSRFMPAEKLTRLAMAKVSNGLFRSEAQQLLQRIIFKAAEINAHPAAFPSSVFCLVVFGSYLTDADHLGDLDVGVGLHFHPSPTTERSGAFKREMAAELATRNKAFAALRLRRPSVISIHTLREVMDLRTPYRVVYGSLAQYRPTDPW